MCLKFYFENLFLQREAGGFLPHHLVTAASSGRQRNCSSEAAGRAGSDRFRPARVGSVWTRSRSYLWVNRAPNVIPAAPSTASPNTVLRDQKLAGGLDSPYNSTKASWVIRERRGGALNHSQMKQQSNITVISGPICGVPQGSGLSSRNVSVCFQQKKLKLNIVDLIISLFHHPDPQSRSVTVSLLLISEPLP